MRIKGLCRPTAALLGAFMLTMPALAQQKGDAPARQSDDIIVNGKGEGTPAEVRKQARSVTQPSGSVYSVPLAMFQAPVCPGIVGMSVDIAEVMVSRIRSNAEKIGIDVAKEGKCAPNIIVAFVRNGQETIRDLQKRRSYLFKHITVDELRKMAADPGPVHAWVNTEVRGRHGDTLRGDDDAGLFNPPSLYVANSHSHIFLASRLDISNSVVLIDLPAVNGMSAVQIADYATMRTFARTRPVGGDAAASTILSLFDPESPRPAELTDFDIAYLRSIYEGIPNLISASKLAHINSELRQRRAEREAEGDVEE